MKRSQYTDEQMIEADKQMEAARPARDVARELGVTDLHLAGDCRTQGGVPLE